MSDAPQTSRPEDHPQDSPPAEAAERKVVIDEDWKERVRKEREAANAARRAQSRESGEPAEAAAGEVPPASFAALVTMLAAQAAAALGQLPDPREGRPVMRPDIARHCVDTLAMLEEKTQGNLTEEESHLLTRMLHELRMLFLSAGARQ